MEWKRYKKTRAEKKTRWNKCEKNNNNNYNKPHKQTTIMRKQQNGSVNGNSSDGYKIGDNDCEYKWSVRSKNRNTIFLFLIYYFIHM